MHIFGKERTKMCKIWIQKRKNHENEELPKTNRWAQNRCKNGTKIEKVIWDMREMSIVKNSNISKNCENCKRFKELKWMVLVFLPSGRSNHMGSNQQAPFFPAHTPCQWVAIFVRWKCTVAFWSCWYKSRKNGWNVGKPARIRVWELHFFAWCIGLGFVFDFSRSLPHDCQAHQWTHPRLEVQDSSSNFLKKYPRRYSPPM